MIPMWCEKNGIEYKEIEWAALNIDVARCEELIDKPAHRREECMNILTRLVEQGVKGDPFNRFVRLVKAFDIIAARPGNFKAKAANESLGSEFFTKAGARLFKDFDPAEIVKLRKEGKL